MIIDLELTITLNCMLGHGRSVALVGAISGRGMDITVTVCHHWPPAGANGSELLVPVAAAARAPRRLPQRQQPQALGLGLSFCCGAPGALRSKWQGTSNLSQLCHWQCQGTSTRKYVNSQDY